MKKFTVNENHLRLLKNMYVSWDDCEFGAPQINPKRPYGNSDVEGDIAEILGLELFEDAYGEKHISKEQNIYINKIHKEMETVLQILVCNLSIQVGQYECQKYCSKWNLIKG